MSGADSGAAAGAVFDALGDPVRRRIMELLGDGERPAGALVAALAEAPDAAAVPVGHSGSEHGRNQHSRDQHSQEEHGRDQHGHERGRDRHRRGGISQPAVSQHLKVLREAGLVTVRAEGTRRIYGVDERGLAAVQAWLARFADGFAGPLDALETELARGKRERRLAERRDGTASRSENAAEQPERGVERAESTAVESATAETAVAAPSDLAKRRRGAA